MDRKPSEQSLTVWRDTFNTNVFAMVGAIAPRLEITRNNYRMTLTGPVDEKATILPFQWKRLDLTLRDLERP